MRRDFGFRDRVATIVRRATIFLIALSFFTVLCAAQSNPAPQTQAGSARLASISVTGSKRFTSDQIAASLGLHAGATVTRDDIQNGANRLSQLGLFATVQYRFGGSGTDVKLEYQVTDAPALPATFDNFPWFTGDEIVQALKSSVVLFDGTAPDHGTILDDISAALEKLLSSKGVQAGVSHQVVQNSSPEHDQSVQQFRAEGTDLTIASVNFSDPLANNDRAIQSNLANFVGSPFSRTAIELFEFEQVRPSYLTRGFLKVHFAPPGAHLEASQPNTPSSRVAVNVTIDPGPAFNWSGVTWMGNSAIRSAQLDTAVTLKRGELADGVKIEATWDRVRDLFGRLGFLDLKLDAVPQFDDAAKGVSYVVTITEGPQYRMGNLVISGLSIEGERRIRDAWKIPMGSLFDQVGYEQFLDTGVKEAFTGLPVHYDKIGRFLQEDAKAGTVDVLLDFQ
jgi:outer membrane protein assembly factor BamA